MTGWIGAAGAVPLEATARPARSKEETPVAGGGKSRDGRVALAGRLGCLSHSPLVRRLDVMIDGNQTHWKRGTAITLSMPCWGDSNARPPPSQDRALSV